MSNTIAPALQPLLANNALELSTAWKIQRTDGTIFRFTDHNAPIELGIPSETYEPVNGVSASARQRASGLEIGNAEVYGILDDSRISVADLRSGLFREAKITEQLFWWRYPWLGPIIITRYWISKLTWTGESWEATIVSTSAWLNRKVGNIYGRTCRHTFADSMCKANGVLIGGNFELTGQTVTSVQQATTELTASGISGQADNHWGFGNLTWTSGNNSGLSFEVKTNDSNGSHITLQLPTPNAIEVGDQFTIRAGCDKTWVSCSVRFTAGELLPPSIGNINNFGGFPTIPGTDRLLEGPPPKGENGIASKLGLDYFK